MTLAFLFVPKPKTIRRISGHQDVDAGRGELAVELQAVAADGDRGEQQRREHDVHRPVAAEPRGQEADVAVGGDEARAQLELGAGQLVEAAEAGERAADDHRRQQQHADLQARAAGRLGVAPDHPQAEAPRRRAEDDGDDRRRAEGDEQAGVHPTPADQREPLADRQRPRGRLAGAGPVLPAVVDQEEHQVEGDVVEQQRGHRLADVHVLAQHRRRSATTPRRRRPRRGPSARASARRAGRRRRRATRPSRRSRR